MKFIFSLHTFLYPSPNSNLPFSSEGFWLCVCMGVICDISASLSSILSSCNPLTLLPRITIYFFKNLVSATHMSFLSENILKVFFFVWLIIIVSLVNIVKQHWNVFLVFFICHYLKLARFIVSFCFFKLFILMVWYNY